jgi:hypothetical protein
MQRNERIQRLQAMSRTETQKQSAGTHDHNASNGTPVKTPASDQNADFDDFIDGLLADDGLTSDAAILARTLYDEPINLRQLLSDFVDLYAGMKQRGHEWYRSMATTVGGSEIAAVMGMNPYSSFNQVVLSKIASLQGGSTWDGGGEACWWGVLFEDVIAAVTAIDLGDEILGDEICIQEIPGHRNSPDGYIVARFYRTRDGVLHLWTTDRDPAIACEEKILMLEFKCPISRKPTTSIPRHYKPQLWSGLMVSPVAHSALFVDSVFRKCSIADMGDSPDFDTIYHKRDTESRDNGPFAWGLVGIYAPTMSAPRNVRYGWRGKEWAAGDPSSDGVDADAALAAWQIHSTYFGALPSDATALQDLIDFGDAESTLFNRMLYLVNCKRFQVTRVAPCFADGRGIDLHSSQGISRVFDALREETPADHWFVGYLPWKLFEINYLPADRRLGYFDEVMPLIEKVHKTAADAMASGDPMKFMSDLAAATYVPPPAGKSSGIDESDVQDFFDDVVITQTK